MNQRTRFVEHLKEQLEKMEEDNLENRLEAARRKDGGMSNCIEYIEQTKEKLDELSAEIAVLKAKVTRAGKKIKREFDSHFEKIETIAHESRKELNEIMNATNETWERRKPRMDKLVERMGATLKETERALEDS